MAPRFSTIPPEHLDTVRPQSNRPRRRHALTGIALAAASPHRHRHRGDVRQSPRRKATPPPRPRPGHRPGHLRPLHGPLTWSVSTSGRSATVRSCRQRYLRVRARHRRRRRHPRRRQCSDAVGRGEALAVRPGDNLTVQAAGVDQGSLSLLTLSPADQPARATRADWQVLASPGAVATSNSSATSSSRRNGRFPPPPPRSSCW